MSDNNRKLPDDIIEKIILKGMLKDEKYLANIISTFKTDYFINDNIAIIFNEIKDYFTKYKKVPSNDIISQFTDNPDKINNILNEINSIDFDIASHLEFLYNESNKYLKEQAIKDAFMKGVDLIEQKRNPNEFRELLEEALAKDLNIDLGINYWNDLGSRLKRIFSESKEVCPSFYYSLDEIISGGFPPYTLSIFLAKIHGYKTTFLINMASRQAMQGYNPVFLSLEMSEDAICQRLDSIYSGMDINRMYLSKSNRTELTKRLKDIKNKEGMGTILIKEFPTGNASVSDFRIFLRELQYRNIKPGPIYCDYINLMKPEYKAKGDLYQDVKSITEQLRALSLEFNTPVISVSQLNRIGASTTFEEVDFTNTAESYGAPATADFIGIFGQNTDTLVYKSELHCKIVKNRLGGMVGEIIKFYTDKKSLKIYDNTELNLWIEDAKKKGEEREIAS